jgi:hypothetical protein
VIVYVMNWDLPSLKANLDVYMNKARNDWIPFTLNHPGVRSLKSYRNILETTPQVAVVIEFETLDSWKEYVGSSTYMRLMRELRILGCQHIMARVWSLWEMGGGPPTQGA